MSGLHKHHKFPLIVLRLFTATAREVLGGAGALQSSYELDLKFFFV